MHMHAGHAGTHHHHLNTSMHHNPNHHYWMSLQGNILEPTTYNGAAHDSTSPHPLYLITIRHHTDKLHVHQVVPWLMIVLPCHHTSPPLLWPCCPTSLGHHTTVAQVMPPCILPHCTCAAPHATPSTQPKWEQGQACICLLLPLNNFFFLVFY
jgi:hypothetical protein